MDPKQRHLTEYDLKKQSQFAEGQMNVTVSTIKDYKGMRWRKDGKNKANQSQLAGLWPETLNTQL